MKSLTLEAKTEQRGGTQYEQDRRTQQKNP